MKYDIFISYSSKDQAKVSSYVSFLRRHGYSVWIDQVGISHGHEFPEEITKAIQNCSILLFFSSINSNSSKWVKRELVFADKHNKMILPICLDPSEYNQSLQLLLSGVEHIEEFSKSEEDVKKTILISVEREIGNKDHQESCPVTKQVCPIEGRNNNTSPFVQEQINVANSRLASKYEIRCEAFVFTALCEAIWLIIIGCCLIPIGILSHTFSLFVSTVVAYFLAMYTTHLSTNSFYVPGWYNRHLTTYGALILAMDFFITVACLSISSAFSIGVITSLLFFFCSILGSIGIICLYRLRRLGYYILWIDSVIFAASSYNLWSDNLKFIGPASLFLLFAFAMLILTYTLKLRFNGSSTWGLLFGKEKDSEDQEPSIVELFLMKIWINLYK